MPTGVPRHQQTRARRRNTAWIVGSVIAAVVLVGGLIVLNSKLSRPVSPPKMSAGHVWGQASAPVSIEVFSDFQ